MTAISALIPHTAPASEIESHLEWRDWDEPLSSENLPQQIAAIAIVGTCITARLVP